MLEAAALDFYDIEGVFGPDTVWHEFPTVFQQWRESLQHRQQQRERGHPPIRARKEQLRNYLQSRSTA